MGHKSIIYYWVFTWVVTSGFHWRLSDSKFFQYSKNFFSVVIWVISILPLIYRSSSLSVWHFKNDLKINYYLPVLSFFSLLTKLRYAIFGGSFWDLEQWSLLFNTFHSSCSQHKNVISGYWLFSLEKLNPVSKANPPGNTHSYISFILWEKFRTLHSKLVCIVNMQFFVKFLYL